MADYVSIISRAIAALSDNNAENRETVYSKARATIDRKLRAIEPTPAENVIQAQLDQLESAIRQVEAEQLAGEAAAEIEAEADTTREEGSAREAPQADAEPEAESTPNEPAMPVEIVIPPANPPEGFVDSLLLIDGIGDKTVAMLEDEGLHGISQVAAMDEVSLAALTDKIGIPNFEVTQEWKAQAQAMLSGELPRSRTDRERLEKFKVEMAPPVKDIGLTPSTAEEPAVSSPEVVRDGDLTAETSAPPDRSDEPAPPQSEDWLPPVSEEIESQVPDPFAEPAFAEHGGNAEAEPESLTEIEGEEPFRDQSFPPELQRKRGGGGKALTWLVFLALLAGAGYGAYVYRDQLTELADEAVNAGRELFEADKPNTPEVSEPAAVEGDQASSEAMAEQTPAAEKDGSRLGDGEPDPITQDPIELTPSEEPAPVTDQTDGTGASDTASDAPMEATGQDVGNTTVEVADGEPSADGAEASASESQTGDVGTSLQPDQLVVVAGERAYLYEEGASASNASRDEGNIVWQLAQEPPEPGSDPEAVIKGLMEIPGRGLVMNLTIKRNVDEALPASHLIELLFTAPPEFSGGNIDEIFRFVMKSTEESRGESLVGVPAKIDTGFFLIALNNLPQAQETNLNLLQNANWVDIPVQYVTGKRGLVTFEKGLSGVQIFAQAFEDWQNR